MQTDETEQEVVAREPVAEGESGTEKSGAPPERSRRMLYLAAAAMSVLVLTVGAWLLMRGKGSHEAVPAAGQPVVTPARGEMPGVPAVVDATENLHLLEAARKAHEEILSADTVPGDAGMVPPAVSPTVPTVTSPAPMAVPEPVPAPAPASVRPKEPEPTGPVSEKPAGPAANVPVPPVNIPPRPSPPKVQPSVANDPALIRSGGCSPNGESPKEFGAVLGRCLEEFSRMEAEARAAKPARRPR